MNSSEISDLDQVLIALGKHHQIQHQAFSLYIGRQNESAELILGGYDLHFVNHDVKYWDVMPIISTESFKIKYNGLEIEKHTVPTNVTNSCAIIDPGSSHILLHEKEIRELTH